MSKFANNRASARDVRVTKHPGGDSEPSASEEFQTPEESIITDGSQLENGKLKENVTYTAGEHGYKYTTNSRGLITKASASNLKLKTHEGRLQHSRETPGKISGDHAGHLFGDRFGGSSKLDNLVSQAQKVNLSEFKVIENEWAKAIKEGKEVTVDIEIKYADDDLRPIAFDVKYKIGDMLYSKTIEQ